MGSHETRLVSWKCFSLFSLSVYAGNAKAVKESMDSQVKSFGSGFPRGVHIQVVHVSVWGGVVTCCRSAACWRVMAKRCITETGVGKQQSASVLKKTPDQRHDDPWLKHGDVMVERDCSQMKVESMVLVSCALRARASKSCFIKADFSCSSWAIRSLFSVTSLMRKQEKQMK